MPLTHTKRKIMQRVDELRSEASAEAIEIAEFLCDLQSIHRRTITDRFHKPVRDIRNILSDSFGIYLTRKNNGHHTYYVFEMDEEFEQDDRRGLHPCSLPVSQVKTCRTQCYLADKCEAAKNYQRLRQQRQEDLTLRRLNVHGESSLAGYRVHVVNENIVLSERSRYGTNK